MNNRTCSTCRYWSDQAATIIPPGGMTAMCLSAVSENSGQFTPERQSCTQWAENWLGSIDDPMFGDVTEALAAYAEADNTEAAR